MFVIDGGYVTPCRRVDPDLFQERRNKKNVALAKTLCGTCRVQLICLEKALHYEEISGESLKGIHGGLTEAERTQTRLNRIA